MTNTIGKQVARLVADTRISEGVGNWQVAQAGNGYGLAGTTRLRELAKMFRIIDGKGTIPYYYSHNRYYPSRAFKVWCRRYANSDN